MQLMEILAAQRKGRLLIEAQEALREVVKTCQDTGRPGKFVLTLEIRQGSENTLVLKDIVDKKLPRPTNHGSSYYPDETGDLFKDNPKQPEFDIVNEPAAQAN